MLGAQPIAAPMVPTSPTASDLHVATDSPQTWRARRDARRAEQLQRLKERRDLEDFQLTPRRKGLYLGHQVTTGATIEPNSFIPAFGYRFEVGGGLGDRVTLGVAAGLHGNLGIRKGTAGAVDVVMHAYALRGLFLKLGVGATSHAPQRNRLERPGFGGVIGLGWEFRPLRMMGITVSGDFDARVRTDGRLAQALLLNLGMRLYPDFKKKW
jgi:hypothetical protein